MSDADNPYKRDRAPDPDNPYARRKRGPVPRSWATGGEGSLTAEDIKAIAVAVVDEMERRNRSIFE